MREMLRRDRIHPDTEVEVELEIDTREQPGILDVWWEGDPAVRPRFEQDSKMVVGRSASFVFTTQATVTPGGRPRSFVYEQQGGGRWRFEVRVRYHRVPQSDWNEASPTRRGAPKLSLPARRSGRLLVEPQWVGDVRRDIEERHWWCLRLERGDLLGMFAVFPRLSGRGFYARVDVFGPVDSPDAEEAPRLLDDWLVHSGYGPVGGTGTAEELLSVQAAGWYFLRLEATWTIPAYEWIVSLREAVGEVRVRTELPGGGDAPLPRAWVYWRDNERIELYRTDDEGRVRTLRPGGERTHPGHYDGLPLETAAGVTAGVAASTASRPVPPSWLEAGGRVFQEERLALAQGTEHAVVVLPARSLRIDSPRDLSIWPLLWEPDHPDWTLRAEADRHPVRGLPQGAALWTVADGAGELRLVDGGPAAPLPPAERRRERLLRVEGEAPSWADRLELGVTDELGDPLPCGLSDTGGVQAERVLVQLGEPGPRGLRPFGGWLRFHDPAGALGRVYVVAAASSGAERGRTEIELSAPVLAGVQVALVADAADGRTPGPVPDTAGEVHVVDFLRSPHHHDQDDGLALRALSDQTRARRMTTYPMGSRLRGLAADPGPGRYEQPEMPLWMAELHLVGLDRDRLERLLQERRAVGGGGTPSLRLVLPWELVLSWDAPNSARAVRPYRVEHRVQARQAVSIRLGTGDRIEGATEGGWVRGALDPAPTRIPYPVRRRRLPRVFVAGTTRSWGRDVDAPRPALVAQWQPRIEDAAGEPVLRGGDGHLILHALEIDGRPAARGALVPPGSEDGAPVALTLRHPAADLPTFRVTGVNSGRRAVERLLDRLVDLQVAQGGVVAPLLTGARWRATARAIVQHESFVLGHRWLQFWPGTAGRYHWDRRADERWYYGYERGTPLFGAPAGFGVAQLDSPAPTNDQVWSVVANLREAVRRLFEVYGAEARVHLRGLGRQDIADADRRQAVFQRETVRRYNAGALHEFVADPAPGGDVLIDTPVTLEPNRGYPNAVLGTEIDYDAQPAAFGAQDYGPGF